MWVVLWPVLKDYEDIQCTCTCVHKHWLNVAVGIYSCFMYWALQTGSLPPLCRSLRHRLQWVLVELELAQSHLGGLEGEASGSGVFLTSMCSTCVCTRAHLVRVEVNEVGTRNASLVPLAVWVSNTVGAGGSGIPNTAGHFTSWSKRRQ